MNSLCPDAKTATPLCASILVDTTLLDKSPLLRIGNLLEHQVVQMGTAFVIECQKHKQACCVPGQAPHYICLHQFCTK